jgi:hypothetical protein
MIDDLAGVAFAAIGLLALAGLAAVLVACGVLARAVRRPELDARCAFEWGCVLGPIGVLVVMTDRLRRASTSRR